MAKLIDLKPATLKYRFPDKQLTVVLEDFKLSMNSIIDRVNQFSGGITITKSGYISYGVDHFINLLDVPQSYPSSVGNFLVRVKSTVNGLEFADLKGTANQITVTENTADFTLSLPQDIHTAASPTFVTVKLSGLTDGYVPYHVADATGLANSSIRISGTLVGIGMLPVTAQLEVNTSQLITSTTAAPYLKIINASDTERDPVIQFAVGATPVTKWTMGLDDSDVNKWKLTVGADFGNHHDIIAISSGEGATPPVAEFTLISSYAATTPRGICEDGNFLYYSDGTASQQLVKVNISTGAEVTRSPDIGADRGNCVTDGTHVYVHDSTNSVILKYLCSDLSYVATSSTWFVLNKTNGLVYFSGHLYLANLDEFNIRKIRCSDMATVWTTSFTQGSGTDQMNRPVGLTTDGQYIYVQDYWTAGGNNRIVRLNMDGTWVDSVVVSNTLDGGDAGSIAMWCAGNYVYNTAYYTSVYKVEKRNKSDLSISETFSVVPTKVMAGCQSGDYHYIVNSSNNFIYKYQYIASDAAGESGIQFRLQDVYGQFNDIAKLTAAGNFGVGTTIPSERIEAVGNIKATAGQFISTMAIGTSPMSVQSTTVNTNFNADLLDGSHASAFAAVDHSILSATHGDTTAAAVQRGDLVTGQGSTAKWVRLGKGTVGQFLKSDGTDIAWAAHGLTYTDVGAEVSGAVATHAALITGIHGLVFTAGKTLTLTESLTLNALPVGGLAVATGANALGSLAVGLTTQVLVGGGAATVPAWTTDIPTAVTIGSAYVYRVGGTDVAVADGGTNKSSWTLYSIPYASGTTTIGEIAIGTAGQVLAVNGGANGYTWSSPLTNPMTDIGDIIIGGVAGAPAKLADVAVGSYLRSGGVTTAPLWSTLTLPNAGTAYRLPVFSATNVMTELAAVGATGEYLAGATGAVPSWATLNQAAVAGLTTASSPEFVTVKLSGLTDGYVPYHVADATGLANGPIQTNGSQVGIGSTPVAARTLYVLGNQAIATGTGYGFFSIGPTRTVAVAETNYFLGFAGGILADGGYHIDSGITDSGYRLGVDVNAYCYDATFKGTLAENYGLRILHGIILAGDSGARTITSSYGLYINGLDSAGTITNKWGIYVVSATDKNYMAGQLQVGLGFGCNSKTPQTAYASGGAVDTGTVDSTYGAAERDVITSLRTIVNNLRAALIANGICS